MVADSGYHSFSKMLFRVYHGLGYRTSLCLPFSPRTSPRLVLPTPDEGPIQTILSRRYRALEMNVLTIYESLQ